MRESRQPAARDTQRLFERYAETFVTGDVDAIVALHAPDSQFWLHLDRPPAIGRDEIAATFAALFEQWPKLGVDVCRVITGLDHWMLDWTLTAEFVGADGTAVPVGFDCVDIVTVLPDGLVDRKDTFVDYAQLRRALAAVGSDS